MRRVACTIEEVELEGDYSQISGVRATCSECDHQTEAFGTSSASVRRCLVMMREDCPHYEENWYYAEDGEDER